MNINWKLVPLFVISVGGVFLTLESKLKNAPPLVEESRFDLWPASFKANFIRDCSSGVDEDKKRSYQIVCSCFAERMEGEHILPTKYNSVLSSETRFAQEVSNRIGAYFNSPNGQKTKEICANKAKD